MDGWKRSETALVGTAALLVFSRVFGLSIVLPNFRSHFGDEFGVAAIWIGVAFGAHGLTMALMQLPTGLISDRFGRRPVLLISSILFIAGSLAAANAGSIQGLIAARLLQGLGAIGSVAVAAVGETIPTERRTMAMAMVGIPAGMGFLVGIGLGPALYPIVGMSGLFVITAAVGLVAALPVPWLRITSAAERPPPIDTAILPIAALALGGFVSNYALTTTLFFLPTTDWMRLLPMLVVAFIIVGGASRAIDKKGGGFSVVSIGILAVATMAAWFAHATGAWLWIAGAAFFTGHAILQSTLPSQVSRIAGPAGGRGHGVQNIVAYMGTFIGGTVAGLFANNSVAAFGVLGLVAATAALMTYSVRPQA